MRAPPSPGAASHPHRSGVPVGKMPAQKERVVGARAGRQRALQAHRADGAELRRFGPERAVFREVVPEAQRARPPASPRPAAHHRHAGIRACTGNPHTERADEGVVLVQRGVVHQQPLDSLGRPHLVDAWVRAKPRLRDGQQRVFERVRDRHGRWNRLRVRDAIAQHGNRKTRCVCVVRDERAECLERHVHGQAPVAEGHFGERELAREPGGLQPLQPGSAPRPEAEGSLVRRLDAAFEHAHERRPRAAIHADCRKRVAGRVAAVGSVENLPVAELPAAAEPDRAGADAAERKRNLREPRTSKHARIRHSHPFGLRDRPRRWFGARSCGLAALCTGSTRDRGSCRGGQGLLQELAPATGTIIRFRRHMRGV